MDEPTTGGHARSPRQDPEHGRSNEPDAGQLRARVISGAGWKALTTSVSLLVRVLVTLVLARLLTPADFGLAAMAAVFAALALLLADPALGSALIQRRVISEADRSTVFWATSAIGLFLTVAGIALAGPIADLYGEPEVKPLFAVLSLSFVVTALGTTQAALLARELSFRGLELRMLAGNVAGAVVAIVAAVLGAGAWAIVLGWLAVSLVSTALLWMFSDWRPQFVFSRASFRNLAGFSGNVFVSKLLFYGERNADNFLIGRYLGAASLGAYSVAYNLMLIPVQSIAAPIRQLLFPAFSRIQDDTARLVSVWLRVTRLIAALTAPIVIGMLVVAPDFVPVVLGERWSAAIPVLQILAAVGFLQAVESLNGSLLVARNRSGTMLRFSFGALALSLIGFGVGLAWGIEGVATGYLIAATVSCFALSWLAAREIGSSLRQLWGSLAGVVQAALILAAALFIARAALVEYGVSEPVRLAILVALGAAVYLPCCAWRAPEVVAEIREVRRARPGPPSTDPATLSGGSA